MFICLQYFQLLLCDGHVKLISIYNCQFNRSILAMYFYVYVYMYTLRSKNAYGLLYLKPIVTARGG